MRSPVRLLLVALLLGPLPGLSPVAYDHRDTHITPYSPASAREQFHALCAKRQPAAAVQTATLPPGDPP